MYKDFNYAEGRLRNTIIRDGDGACFVGDVMVDPDGDIVLKVVPIDEIETNDWDDVMEDLDEYNWEIRKLDEFDLTPVNLGYVNGPRDTCYVSRKPMRECWRQGLNYKNCQYKGNWRPPFKYLRTCVKNDYPSFAYSASKMSIGNSRSIAFSRDFALHDEGKLFFRGDKVGKYNEYGVTLDNKYEYLHQHLQMSLG